MRARYLLVSCLVIALVSVVVCGPVFAQTWTVAPFGNTGNGFEYYMPDNISFRFSGNQLLLNNQSIRTPGNSSRTIWDLGLGGNWASCGSLVNSVWIPDPYATFVIERSDVPEYEYQYDEHHVLLPYSDVWTSMGYMNWLPATPANHPTHLVLGATGTVQVLRTWGLLPMGGSELVVHSADIAFTAHSPVPEPSSLVALGALVTPLLAFRRRRA